MTGKQNNSENGESDGDRSNNPADKQKVSIDEEKLANKIKQREDFSNVYVRAGDIEVSIETNEDVNTTVTQALAALKNAEEIYDHEKMPTHGVN